MKTIDILRRAGKSLRQAKARTILTSLAIAVGAFTIALAMAAGNGGRAYLDSMVAALGSTSNINVSAIQAIDQSADDKPKKVTAEQPVEAPSSYEDAVKMLTPADVEKFKTIEGVETVLPMHSVAVRSVSANGSDEYEAEIDSQSDDGRIELTTGTLGENYEIKPGEVVLPHIYLESFGFTSAEQALDKNVQATFDAADGSSFTRDFTIAAVDKEPTSPLAFYYNQFRISNQDGEAISNLQRPAGQAEGYYSVMVRAEKGANVDEVKNAIEAAGSYDAQTFAEMQSEVMNVVNIVQYGLMAFGALAIIASVFGIINTQYISVLERTSQIGLMKALGMRRRDIAKLFRYEAAWIGFLGGVIGVGLAFLVTLLNPIITGVLSLEAGTQLLQIDWLMSGILIVGLVIVAVVSGWLPSRKAARMDPIEALRSE